MKKLAKKIKKITYIGFNPENVFGKEMMKDVKKEGKQEEN